MGGSIPRKNRAQEGSRCLFFLAAGERYRPPGKLADNGAGQRSAATVSLGRDRAAAGVTHGVSWADASLIPGRGALLHVASG